MPIILFIISACVAKNHGTPQTRWPQKPQPTQTVDARVIYGHDDRREIYNVDDPVHAAWADATVGVFDETSLAKQPDGSGIVTSKTFADLFNLCQSEPFREQTSAAFCSGFLVAPDIVVTAGHCIGAGANCAKASFAFGFSLKKPGANPKIIPAQDLYGCKEVIKSQQPYSGADFAIVRLDRPVRNHTPAPIRQKGSLKLGDKLVLIGHPSGIPTKVAANATVREIPNSAFFVANTDSYGGNSGSAVFNALTGEVEGVLVRGETDFETVGSCVKSKVCTDEGCRGEDVTAIANVIPYLQN